MELNKGKPNDHCRYCKEQLIKSIKLKNRAMSKEQTPIEELQNFVNDEYPITIEELRKVEEYDNHYRLLKTALFYEERILKFLRDYKKYITKEKEQREELIKEIAIECLDLQLNEVEETYKKFGCEEIAEQYYNEVIKPKYKL